MVRYNDTTHNLKNILSTNDNDFYFLKCEDDLYC